MNSGFWITRSLSPAKSSAFSIGTAAVGHLAKAVLPEAQADQPLVGQLGQQLLPERAVQQASASSPLCEQERQVDQPERLQPVDVHQRRSVRHGHLQRAALQRRDHGDVVAQRAAGEQLDLDLAAALLRQEIAELLDRLGLRVILGEADAHLDRALADVLRRRCRSGEQPRTKRRDKLIQSHGFLPVAGMRRQHLEFTAGWRPPCQLRRRARDQRAWPRYDGRA